jgi:hypothetical protein
VDARCLGIASDSIEQHRLSHPTQADQHRALGVATEPSALERDTHLLE